MVIAIGVWGTNIFFLVLGESLSIVSYQKTRINVVLY